MRLHSPSSPRGMIYVKNRYRFGVFKRWAAFSSYNGWAEATRVVKTDELSCQSGACFPFPGRSLLAIKFVCRRAAGGFMFPFPATESQIAFTVLSNKTAMAASLLVQEQTD